MRAGNRCERCRHPYTKGGHGSGQWSACDDRCRHTGPVRLREAALLASDWQYANLTEKGMTAAEARMDEGPTGPIVRFEVEAEWRILTCHHLNGVKFDCRWWNLAALCQRCHLTIQAKVFMERPWWQEHSDWFKPHAAGWYAARYLDEDLTHEQAMERMPELLALEHTAAALPIGEQRVYR